MLTFFKKIKKYCLCYISDSVYICGDIVFEIKLFICKVVLRLLYFPFLWYNSIYAYVIREVRDRLCRALDVVSVSGLEDKEFDDLVDKAFNKKRRGGCRQTADRAGGSSWDEPVGYDKYVVDDEQE